MDNTEAATQAPAAPEVVELAYQPAEVTQPTEEPAQPVENPVQPVEEKPAEDVKVENIETSAGEENAVEKKENEEEVFYMSTQEEGATLSSSIINMMNTIVGAGVLSIPSTFKNAGLIGSLLLLALSLFLSLYGARFLSLSAVYTKEESYGFIGAKVSSYAVGVAADIFMIVFDFGVSIAYFIILFSQAIDLLEAWGGIARDTLENNEWWITFLIMFFFGFPLLSVKKLDGLAWASAVAVFCICLFVIISIIKGIGQLAKGGLEYSWLPTSFSGFSSAISVFFTSLCCHVNIPKMTSELRIPKNTKFGSKVKKMNRVSMISFLSCGAIYFVVGAFGYLAYGNNIQGNLLSNFSQDKEAILNYVKLAYAFVVMFSYPVLSYAALVSFDKLCFKQPRPDWRRYLEAFIWSVLSWFIAIKFPVLDKVFGITGSLCGILLCFAIPALYFIGVQKKEKAKEMAAQTPIFRAAKGEVTFAWVLFYVGVVAAVVFTIVQVKDLITSM